MPGLRSVALVPVACVLLVGALPAAQSAERALPETVVVHDSRTSAPIVDIAKVKLAASWYWDSQQGVLVRVPHGFQRGHRLTVWFDLNGDSTPDGHYELKLKRPKNPGGKNLQKRQEFRKGGGWGHSGTRVSCTGSEGGQPVVNPVRRDQQSVDINLDLWDCLQVPSPAGADSGSWRAAVSLTKGRKEDMAPNHHRWSPPVAGWGPCDPSGGPC